MATAFSAHQALEILMAGNQRWVSGQVEHRGQSRERRLSLTAGQAPFAVILSCIDSRVPPELVFDCGLGDLLVVRSAAHAVDDIVAGSVEFGPVELGIPLILVLGHRRCGAATAAVGAFEEDRWPPGHIEDVIDALGPAYRMAKKQSHHDLVDSVVRAHSILTVARLKREKVFADLLRDDRLRVVGGCYDLETGSVDIIG